jgi:hypothetical protein
LTLSGDLLTVDETFSGLLAPATGAHIHCCTPVGTNTIVAVPFTGADGFPLGATSGTFDHTFDLTLTSTYTAGFLSAHGGTAVGAEAALITGLDTDTAYLNIHNSVFPGGEIRGFLTAVPEPSALLVLAGAIGLGLIRRRR